jgi:5'-methylthioadenosine phosphorylase
LHIIPTLAEEVRRKIIDSANRCKIDVTTEGVYWQTTGPRLETKAEIRMMAGYADVVGMTMASEAVIACELDIPYASICSVDNYCHGIVKKQLILQEITEGAQRNTDTILKILEWYIKDHDGSRGNRSSNKS